MRTGEVAGGADERVIVEDVKDAGDRLDDVVLTQFGVGAFTGSFAAAPAVAEPASPPALTPLAIVILLVRATRLLSARALLINVLVASGVLPALFGLGVPLAPLAVVGLATVSGACAVAIRFVSRAAGRSRFAGGTTSFPARALG